MKLAITRTNEPMPSEALELSGVRRVLFECFKGTNPEEDKAWHRFWHRLKALDAGEISFLEFIIPRNGKFHRKFFAMLDVGFDAWEPNRVRKSYKGRAMEKNREQFREDIIILAGFYEQTFDLKGRMRIRAKSIAFANMDDTEFEQLYSAVATVLLREVLKTYKDRAELDAVVDRMMGFI
ncbi:DUF1367 family protein [Sideroxydans lithotrophicus]|uniref:Uncharacterized protein n=1 Tax=Sideroxydans lithotrophicus (strain ES-1) TaxID=580332 RepID=D5CT77_SIDLE|nr:DUF1367 family protein [Sideroxydans lithotrophicus]ADE12163.1 protein of unknown function DUF1367 [Sideroxydans lithotrophicus ES-1]